MTVEGVAARRRPRSRPAGSGRSGRRPRRSWPPAGSPRSARRGPRGSPGARPCRSRTSGSGRRRPRRSPASASAALDDREDRGRAWAAGSPGWSDRPSGPASVVPDDPAGVADDDRPAVAVARLVRPARRDPPASGSARRCHRLGRRSATMRPPGRGRWPAAGPARRVVRGTIESTSRYSAGEWSLPPIGPRPSRRRHAQPGRRVRVGGAAGRRIAERRSRAGRRAPGACSTSRPLRSSFSIGQSAGHRLDARRSCPGTAGRGGERRGPPPRPPRAPRRGRRPDVDLEIGIARRRRSGASRRRSRRRCTVTPGQRPLSVVQARSIWWAAARIALRPFSGSTPAWAARPWTVRRRSTMPLRADTMSPLARAHSRTKQTSAASGQLADERVLEIGEPISSSGLATKTSRSNGQRGAAAARLPDERRRTRPASQARIAYRPASRPPFMSVTPGP